MNSSSATSKSQRTLSRQVIVWQKIHGRHGLPWQQSADAYRVWLSEIMLQQTQVSAVIGYYLRFLKAFPTLEALAQADVEQVLEQWSGLGYYTRARNLHRCAKQVWEQYEGTFPSDPLLLAELPGIGRSTAAAIAAFSYGVASPIMDGNVKRVFCRYFALRGVPGTSKLDAQLWSLAEQEMPNQDVKAYTQGLMDLGATVCTRTKPNCAVCPVSAQCQALHKGVTAELPERKTKKILPTRDVNWLVPLRRNCDGGLEVKLVKRGPGAVWEGLWAFEELLNEAVRSSYSLEETILHRFTHYRLRAKIWIIYCDQLANVEDIPMAFLETEKVRWTHSSEWHQAALPQPIKRFLLRRLSEPAFGHELTKKV